ncbi:MAG: rhodanese-like domain-containing protein [Anaerolineaceae bacterium]|nr:rhodanese-like domain-containing protein [Anaerolineaceae bacterium]
MKRANKKKSSQKTWLWAALAVVLVAAAGLIVALSQPSTQAQGSLPDQVSVAQAAELRDQGAFILDVRQPEEWQQVHIPGATLIPLGELPDRLDEVPQDQEVVVVCRSGNRSAQGRDILRSAGFEQVTSMAGGVTQWQAQGLPVESGQ